MAEGRTARALVWALIGLGILAGCSAPAAGGIGGGEQPVAATPPTSVADDRPIIHALSRLTYGARPGDLERVRAIGLPAWIDRQLRPRTIDDSATQQALAELATLRMPISELLREYPRPDPKLREKIASGEMTRREMQERYPMEKRPVQIAAELQAAKVVRAVTSERQLEEVMVDFWFNHFNVFANKGDLRWYVSAYERDAIRPHALGKFPDLVRATARHPAMLFYLDNWLSARPNFTVPVGPNRGRKAGLNENYARELMELHTLGVDGGYTQKDVTEVARAFTGWTIDRPQTHGRFIFRPGMHDPGEKVVVGQRIAAGGGQEDGERVIEILTRHPSTARFVATKLTRRFVSDTPPPALVARVASTYTSTGGDIPAMLRVIFESREFYAEDAYRAKIKKPFEFVASAVRALGGRADAQGGLALARASAEIGEPLYLAQPPTGPDDRGPANTDVAKLAALVIGSPEFQRR